MSLAEALERAASALSDDADTIRPANGDPFQLLDSMEAVAGARLLAWLLANEPEEGAELADVWAEDDRGIAALSGVDEAALSKPGRKALRRVFHRLRSRGVEIAAEPVAEKVVAHLPKIEEDFEAAFVSALDPSGALLCYLVESSDTGGARLFELLSHATRGLERFEVYNAGRSRVRKYIREMRSSARMSAVEVDPQAVRALITRCAALHPADRPLPKSFSNWRSHLAPEDAAQATPGELVRDALGEDTSPEQLRAAADLVRDGVLGPWPPAMDRISALTTQIREATESEVIISEAAESDRLETAVQNAASELYTGDFAERTTDRFLHSAYVLWKMDEESRARLALSAAAAFRDLPPEENPVAVALLEIALGPALKALRETEPSESEASA